MQFKDLQDSTLFTLKDGPVRVEDVYRKNGIQAIAYSVNASSQVITPKPTTTVFFAKFI